MKDKILNCQIDTDKMLVIYDTIELKDLLPLIKALY